MSYNYSQSDSGRGALDVATRNDHQQSTLTQARIQKKKKTKQTTKQKKNEQSKSRASKKKQPHPPRLAKSITDLKQKQKSHTISGADFIDACAMSRIDDA
jgi:hypothetical protein